MLDLIGDFVTILNQGSQAEDLGGWTLKSVRGSQLFRFPDDFQLLPGYTVTVWSGSNADKKNHPPTSLFWTKKFVWNNNGDSAVLYNREGDLVDSFNAMQAIPNKLK
eukprot:TRINITY_DN1515_c0_g1_i2.p1 TRINITY_DN1515_c0_g1~~TRINITY_DN1515_c0_g1_i2.p1  ORF type:complete len:107 (-),score=15.50 TRINITY_DN1515_c0_g1_i2:53-373(-)